MKHSKYNIEQTKRKIQIMQAWVDGKTIEIKGEDSTQWEECTSESPYWNEPHWDWVNFDYRIKDEPIQELTLQEIGILDAIEDGQDIEVRYKGDENHTYEWSRYFYLTGLEEAISATKERMKLGLWEFRVKPKKTNE